jgi:hypothetical protein
VRVLIRRTDDGRYFPRVVGKDGAVLRRCVGPTTGHRHWTKITARDCGQMMLSRLTAEREESGV